MLKVFIIDDEEPIRYLLKRIIPFGRLGMKLIGEAEDGLEALQMIKKLRPDIIITDIRMPGIDGLEFIEAAKKVLPLSKMIIISAYNDFSYAQSAVRIGAFDYILKPINNELEGTLKRVKEDILKERKIKNGVKKISMEIIRLREQNPEAGCADSPQHNDDDIVGRKAVAYIYDNFNRDLTLQSVSESFYITPGYFSKLFKRETGKGFSEFLEKTRLEKAKTILTMNELRIQEIANMVGYRDSNYFIKVFKKHYGMSPLKYRRQHTESSKQP